ncbi:MaoC/PaaZ C-terminal domain-containing protein [Marivita sp. S2033]|uniref:MaoC/PaaZ C-terminal domain-containing protein n=1 Tax=Marivita sp. S2033 TaxID=3373187 RepID=UPI00398298F7
MIDLTEDWLPTQAEFDRFAEVSGDNNAIHVDPAFAARTGFGHTVSHGMLIYTKLWGMLRREHPTLRQVSQSMMFPNPCFAGEPVVLRVTGTAPGTLTLVAYRRSDEAELLLAESEVAR